MAKQTFTTGQVLTAAQVTSLQATALGGGATTAKTVSYTLVAADAGTVVQMNSASATTITVNTGLFAAGDTVQIQNVGSGVCTVTAGTATVNTSSTLALKQYDAGSLYFNSASAAIFFAVDAADGMTNPFTTTGDTVYASGGTTPTRLGIGSTAQVLTVSGGVPAWAAASSGALTLISRSSYSNVATVAFDNVFTSTYKTYLVYVENHYAATGTDDMQFQMRYAGPTTQASAYYGASLFCNYNQTAATGVSNNNATQMTMANESGVSASPNNAQIVFNGVGTSSERALFTGMCNIGGVGGGISSFGGLNDTARTYTGFLLKSSSTNTEIITSALPTATTLPV